MLIYSDGEVLKIVVGLYREASKVGRYMAAVGRFLNSNEIDHLEPFIGKTVKDKAKKAYPLETDPNVLYRLATTGLLKTLL